MICVIVCDHDEESQIRFLKIVSVIQPNPQYPLSTKEETKQHQVNDETFHSL
jgi:hypothetical protein